MEFLDAACLFLLSLLFGVWRIGDWKPTDHMIDTKIPPDILYISAGKES
jgi:hypothetical protein